MIFLILVMYSLYLLGTVFHLYERLTDTMNLCFHFFSMITIKMILNYSYE
jgi:hypothetical protein